MIWHFHDMSRNNTNWFREDGVFDIFIIFCHNVFSGIDLLWIGFTNVTKLNMWPVITKMFWFNMMTFGDMEWCHQADVPKDAYYLYTNTRLLTLIMVKKWYVQGSSKLPACFSILKIGQLLREIWPKMSLVVRFPLQIAKATELWNHREVLSWFHACEMRSHILFLSGANKFAILQIRQVVNMLG